MVPGAEDPLVREFWRVRLLEAQARYELALAEFRRTSAQCQAKDPEMPNRNTAVRDAMATEQAAREEYSQILRDFTDLVLFGRQPADGG